MAKGKKFDKKNAKTFNIVHRSHEDSLYFDNDASKHVLVETTRSPLESARRATGKAYNSAQIKSKYTPEELKGIRENEGLAAQYGITFDDSKYDYMKHLRPIGAASDSVFIERKETKANGEKGIDELFKINKNDVGNTNLEDIIKDALPSEAKRKATHDDMENIPRELQGFRPEMDPRLREVLEALEDEEYVENETGDDFFGELLESGQLDEEDEFYQENYDEEDEWDMDNYQDDLTDIGSDYEPENIEMDNPYGDGDEPEGHEGHNIVVDKAWEKDFKRFKEKNNRLNDWDSGDEFDEDGNLLEIAEGEDEMPDLPLFAKANKKSKNKLRKKMGTMTDTSGFSMSSSANFRTDGLTLLDDRFDQLNKKFEENDEDEKEEFDMKNERPDLEGMLDDFLENYTLEAGGRKLAKKDKEVEAIQKAADGASRGKAAQKRINGRKGKNDMGSFGASFQNLSL